MEEFENYRTVCVEGGDQVGKADAVLNFLNNALEKEESVTHISFPVYASPFGASIRMVLNGALQDYEMDPYEELKTKMAMFALDRLQVFDILLSEKKYKNTVLLFDRSPFSTAVTIGYGLAKIENMTEAELDELIEFAFSLERDMINAFALDNCILQMVSGDWENVRGELRDINETSDVQLAAGKVYEMYMNRFGDSWKQVATRDGGKWRDREDIYNDIRGFMEKRGVFLPSSRNPEILTLNINEIIGMYKGAKVDKEVLEKYLWALKMNEKDLMHRCGIEVAKDISSSFSSLAFNSELTRRSFKSILEKAPETLKVVSMCMGPDFEDKVLESVFNE